MLTSSPPSRFFLSRETESLARTQASIVLLRNPRGSSSNRPVFVVEPLIKLFSRGSSVMCPPPQCSPLPRRKLRVLCLHGFRTNRDIMETQMRKLDRSVLDLLDMTFLNAPYPAEGKSDVEGIFPPPYYEWFQYKRTEAGLTFKHLRECVHVISDFMEKHGPFDGLVGFSQGAFLSAALAGIQQQGLHLTSVQRLRFVVIISGGVIGGEHAWTRCYSEPIKCPSVHFIGERDFLQKDNEELQAKFECPIVIRHGARHTVPRLDEKAVLPMKNFLEHILSSINKVEAEQIDIDDNVEAEPIDIDDNVEGCVSEQAWTSASCAAVA